MQPPRAQVQPGSKRGRGRPPTHGLYSLKKSVAQLTTKRLDGRSVLTAVRAFYLDLAHWAVELLSTASPGQLPRSVLVPGQLIDKGSAAAGPGASQAAAPVKKPVSL